ncbi:Omega-3 fatty acid desaturase [Wickerhamomyces ciferrii]|uniref:Omega-3 fatty acid desaturase n=1 Tax=Wickerhamomyces ciferrii (strain ATCC 14091 / BCRC 22168 / CBS 111 / JCM 3599 / NBRC 0793 / NRRL Y-1031 F-60-10) TaxID=1206466 RepID=K0KC75_WICCF|nr:Omega-3 fatty acid desaturase [Wickerhamomyces ciferrii]CCH42680.1 Omega-3 fatty acid desaturase [Wickerhamomyces ciferrii]
MASVQTLASGSGADSHLESNNLKPTKLGGNVSGLSETPKQAIDTHGNVFNVPDYTIKDILSAIPKHCYERRLLQSLGYVARDIIAMTIIGNIGYRYIPLVESTAVRFVLWSVYSYLLGLFGFGLWILAHECGHGAFSDYGWVNDLVGWVLHSYLLVPYFSWKFSHSKHHKATGHLTRDMVFIPYTKQEYLEMKKANSIAELTEETPIYTFLVLLFQQLGGLHLYLTTNATGQPHPDHSFIGRSHFNPSSPIFDAKDYWYIVLSDIGMLTTFTVVYLWSKYFSIWSAFINWFIPFLWVNHWLVFVTFLQHTDPTMPHYDAEEWTFAKGAAATIDRNFGFVGQHIFHDIIETHVLHHYVSRIPFYNAREATEAIKKVMKNHYRYDGENMWLSLWKVMRSCQFVEGENGVRMFRNTNGIGVKPREDTKN